jgi:hypothetical protein
MNAYLEGVLETLVWFSQELGEVKGQEELRQKVHSLMTKIMAGSAKDFEERVSSLAQ